MIIVATTVGTTGDIAPLCELGVELIKRGHTFKILAQEKFRPLIEEKGIIYCHLSGDANHAMKWLVTDVKTGLEFGTAVFKLKKENPNFMEECEKAVSKDLIELQKRVYRVIQKLNIKAIIQADEIPHMNTNRIHFIGNIPYEAIFPYVRGVVHHGGCTTVGLALYYGKPSLAIPLAMDQHFYGKQIHKLKAGPACLYIRKKLCTEKEIEASILDLMSGKYDEGAKMVQEKMHKENGIEKAIQALEEYGEKYEYKV